MSAHNFTDLRQHAGHDIECVTYGIKGYRGSMASAYAPMNVAVECVTCSEVLLDFDRDDE